MENAPQTAPDSTGNPTNCTETAPTERALFEAYLTDREQLLQALKACVSALQTPMGCYDTERFDTLRKYALGFGEAALKQELSYRKAASPSPTAELKGNYGNNLEKC